jgi:hypothetical protein
MTARSPTTDGDRESPEHEYERLHPGAGGPPSQQQERRAKRNPRTTRDDGGAGLPGGSNADTRGPHAGGPKAGGV